MCIWIKFCGMRRLIAIRKSDVKKAAIGCFLFLSIGTCKMHGQTINKFVDYTHKKAFVYRSTDDENVVIYLLYDEHANPVYYTTKLVGDVCLDNFCKPINIAIYWDLLGNFKDYVADEKHPLTKFDHLIFKAEDHIKLKAILADTNALIGDYLLEDLVDTAISRVSEIEVDAVTKATSKTFESAIISGALYTVYKLWHFVNSDIRKNILKYSTENLFTELEIKRLLLSEDRNYQLFLINYIPDDKIELFNDQIISVVQDKDDFVALHALNRLTNDSWSNEKVQERLLIEMPKYNNPVLIHVLDKLTKFSISPYNLKLLIQVVPFLSGKQLDLAYGILINNKTVVKRQLLKDVQSILTIENRDIQRHTQDLLRQL